MSRRAVVLLLIGVDTRCQILFPLFLLLHLFFLHLLLFLFFFPFHLLLHGVTADGCKSFLNVAAFENLSGVHVAVDPHKKYNVGSRNMRRREIERSDILITELGSVLDVRLHKLLRGEVSMRSG